MVQEVVCYDCGLPSVKGLGPFVGTYRVNGDGEKIKTLVHKLCPGNSDEDIVKLKEEIEKIKKQYLEVNDKRRKRILGRSRKWSTQ